MPERADKRYNPAINRDDFTRIPEVTITPDHQLTADELYAEYDPKEWDLREES